MSGIVFLPGELHSLIAEHCSIKDLCYSSQVSKEWKLIFECDYIWNPIAKKLQAILEDNQPLNFKGIVKNALLEDREIERLWDPEYLTLFGNAQNIRLLPSAGIFTHDQLIETRRIWGGKDYQFSDEQFSAPIQKAYITNENGIERKVILLRVLNRMDQKIYREAIYFFTFGFSSVRSFGLDYTPESKRIISSLYMYLTKQKLERFWRLVHHQPVGLIEKEHLIDFIEGPRFMKDGKSVLELI